MYGFVMIYSPILVDMVICIGNILPAVFFFNEVPERGFFAIQARRTNCWAFRMDASRIPLLEESLHPFEGRFLLKFPCIFTLEAFLNGRENNFFEGEHMFFFGGRIPLTYHVELVGFVLGARPSQRPQGLCKPEMLRWSPFFGSRGVAQGFKATLKNGKWIRVQWNWELFCNMFWQPPKVSCSTARICRNLRFCWFLKLWPMRVHNAWFGCQNRVWNQPKRYHSPSPTRININEKGVNVSLNWRSQSWYGWVKTLWFTIGKWSFNG